MTPLEAVLTAHGMDYIPEGRNRQTKCIYHPDQHASASVDLERGLYQCFTCGVAGDAYSLVMLKEGCSFVDAKRIVSELSGISDDELSRDSQSEGGYLPRKSGHRPGRRGYVPTWLSRQSRNGA